MAWVAKPPVPAMAATGMPGRRWLTPAPTASIRPANSAPGTKGSGGLNWYLPRTISRSGKFRLAALMAMRTSPGLARVWAGRASAARRRRPGFRRARLAWVSSRRGWVVPRKRRMIRSAGDGQTRPATGPAAAAVPGWPGAGCRRSRPDGRGCRRPGRAPLQHAVQAGQQLARVAAHQASGIHPRTGQGAQHRRRPAGSRVRAAVRAGPARCARPGPVAPQVAGQAVVQLAELEGLRRRVELAHAVENAGRHGCRSSGRPARRAAGPAGAAPPVVGAAAFTFGAVQVVGRQRRCNAGDRRRPSAASTAVLTRSRPGAARAGTGCSGSRPLPGKSRSVRTPPIWRTSTPTTRATSFSA
jgi:hypothetical protein